MSFTGFKLAEHCHRTNINSKNSTIIIIIIVITIIIINYYYYYHGLLGRGFFIEAATWSAIILGEGHKLEL